MCAFFERFSSILFYSVNIRYMFRIIIMHFIRVDLSACHSPEITFNFALHQIHDHLSYQCVNKPLIALSTELV